MDTSIKIALTLSGGGYRAAAFHLGVLSYLYSFKLSGEDSLLDKVYAMSTISGGTITGLRYMLGISRREHPENVFNSLYNFFVGEDLANKAMVRLREKKENQTVSLIRTMSDIYNEKLFCGARLGKLMDNLGKNHIKHFSANATDFVNALPFRFQATEGRQITNTGYGIIGNKKLPLPRTIAKHIRLSDILACSSCFPGGFEPMVFPADFDLGESQEVKDYIEKTVSFGIMDGGIVDNQGIEPVILAEDRMVKNISDEKSAGFDLVIISDVSSPYMKPYKPSSPNLSGLLKRLTLNKISKWLWVFEIVISLLTVVSLYLAPGSFVSGALLVILTVISVLLFSYSVLKKKLIKLVKNTVAEKSISEIINLRAGDIAALVSNRLSSVAMLVSTVFMKHIRRMNYRSAYDRNSWKNRLIMNGIYELRPGESWVSKLINKGIPEYLRPGELIQKTTEKAAAMGTTLWFTEKEKAEGVHNALIATGQYTICFNLIEYIELIKKKTANTNKRHKYLISLEDRLKSDWEEFQKDPMYMMGLFVSLKK